MKYTIAIIMIVALLLSGCAKHSQIGSFEECAELYDVMESNPMVCRTPDGKEFIEPIMCTREYMPVCGVDGNTYSNACVAERQNNVEIAYEGECKQNMQIANPASVNCIEKGGKLDIVSSDSGEYGVCVLPDGRVCEEWALMRGECPDDEGKVYCTKEQKLAEICTMEYRPVCGDDNKTYGNPCTACASKNIDYWTEGEC